MVLPYIIQMKKILKVQIFFSVFLSTISLSMRAQVSEGGLPPSFTSASVLKKTAQPYVASIDFDVAKMKSEDAITEGLGLPPRVAQIIDVDLNIENSGEWLVLDSGQRIWQLSLQADGAIATILYYKEFYIPQGGKLFIYNKDHTQVLGAYTERTNPQGAVFATEAVAGDQIVLEYVASQNITNNDKPRIAISGIGYCYNHISVFSNVQTKINESASCQVNINCPEGDEWQHQKKGVARTITPIGSYAYLCSGSVVNNTSDELKPYYLSAHHCFYDEDNVKANFTQMIFYFHYEAPGCERPTSAPTTTRTLVGAQLLVDIDINGGSDGALLLLNEEIPLDYNIFYNGWDAGGDIPQKGVGIHHPKGDVKKISTYTSPASSTIWWDGTVYGATSAHWNVTFTSTANGYSVTEGGSSGSPLFNENGLIVGTLTGGSSTCSYPTGSNLYGKVSNHWDRFDQKMKPYLDPINSGRTMVTGRYENSTVSVDFDADKTSIVEGDSIFFKNLSYGATTLDWVFEGGSPEKSIDNSPKVIYPTAGVYSVTLVVNKGLSNEKQLTKNLYITVKERTGRIVANSFTASLDSQQDKVNLKWERKGLTSTSDVEPVETETVIQRGDGDITDAIKLSNRTKYRVLSKWTPEDMVIYRSAQLKSLRVALNDATATYTLKVIQDGVELYSAKINSVVAGKYNEYELNTPINVDLSKDLLIGYDVEVTNQNSKPVMYGGDAYKDRNLALIDGTQYSAESFGITGSWCIGATALVLPQSDFWYTIYRDGKLLVTDITSGTFVDTAPDRSQSSHCYTIQTTFLDNGVTEMSDPACVDLPELSEPVLFVMERSAGNLRIISKSEIKKVYVFDLNGRQVTVREGDNTLTPMSLSTNQWQPGVYIIRVETVDSTTKYKLTL